MLYTRFSIRLYIIKVIYSGMDISFGSAFGISEGDLHAHELRICGGNGVVAIQRRAMPLSTVLNFNSSLQVLVSHESNPLAINVLT